MARLLFAAVFVLSLVSPVVGTAYCWSTNHTFTGIAGNSADGTLLPSPAYNLTSPGNTCAIFGNNGNPGCCTNAEGDLVAQQIMNNQALFGAADDCCKGALVTFFCSFHCGPNSYSYLDKGSNDSNIGIHITDASCQKTYEACQSITVGGAATLQTAINFASGANTGQQFCNLIASFSGPTSNSPQLRFIYTGNTGATLNSGADDGGLLNIEALLPVCPAPPKRAAASSVSAQPWIVALALLVVLLQFAL